MGQANADAARATSDTHAAANSDRDDATSRHGAQKDRIAHEKERRDGEIDADVERTTGEVDALTNRINATAEANKTEATTAADATKEKQKKDSDALANRINEKSKAVLGQLKKDVQADRDAIANRPVEQFADIPAPVPARPLKMRRPSQAAYYAELTWEVYKGYHLGLLQGVLNIANGVTDIGIGLINEIANIGSVALKYGPFSGTVVTYQYLRDFTGWDPLPFLPQRVTVIGEWDWSRNRITHESDSSHWWSKFLGGNGVLQLLTMGIGPLFSGMKGAQAATAATNATRVAQVESATSMSSQQMAALRGPGYLRRLLGTFFPEGGAWAIGGVTGPRPYRGFWSFLNRLGLRTVDGVPAATRYSKALSPVWRTHAEAHEFVHHVVTALAPEFRAATNMRFLGAFPAYAEELVALGAGAYRAGQWYLPLTMPLNAFLSMTRAHQVVLLSTGGVVAFRRPLSEWLVTIFDAGE